MDVQLVSTMPNHCWHSVGPIMMAVGMIGEHIPMVSHSITAPQKTSCKMDVQLVSTMHNHCWHSVELITTAVGVIGEHIPMVSHNVTAPQETSWGTMGVEEALASLELVPEPPSLDEFICIVQNCRKTKNVAYARRLHMHVFESGLETHRSLGNYLVPMLVECGGVFDAQQVFHRLSYRNEYSWSSLVQGYVECGNFQQALNLFTDMQEGCMNPGIYAFVALLKACAKLKCVERGQEIHGEIVKVGFEGDPFVGNSLVDLYAKSSSLAEAQEVFDNLPARDVVSWNALIAGYVEHGLGEEALECLERMQCGEFAPTLVTFVCILKASSSIGAVRKGQEIHSEIAKEGYELDMFVASALVDMYAKCGLLAEAQEVFDKLPVRDVVLWTALISGYTEQELFEEALHCLSHMQCDGVSPNAVTYICSLKACGSVGAIDKGQEIHAEIVREGFESVPSAGSSLVDMYAKCGSLAEAREVFDELTARDVISWTAMIAGYTEHGLVEEAMICMDQMQVEGMSPDPVMFLCSLKACGSIGAIDKGREIHAEVAQEGCERDLFVGNILVDMYGKCGLLADAREVFDELPIRDVVSWNALIAGYTQYGLSEEAEKCLEQMQLEGVSPNVVSWNTVILDQAEQGENEKVFKFYAQMQEQGISPDSVTFVGMLTASGDSAFIEIGKKIHAQIYRVGGCEATELTVQTALVDMYSKCGSMVDAQQVFDAMPTKDLVGWSALSMGYARQGEMEHFFSLFERMKEEGIQPDEYSLHSILTICSHAGLVGKGQNYIKHISKECGIDFSSKHHNSMVDLLGRAGQIDEAVALLENMPYEPSLVTWSMILGACQNWGNVELARDAFGQVASSIEEGSAPYVLMSNILAGEKTKKSIARD